MKIADKMEKLYVKLYLAQRELAYEKQKMFNNVIKIKM